MAEKKNYERARNPEVRVRRDGSLDVRVSIVRPVPSGGDSRRERKVKFSDEESARAFVRRFNKNAEARGVTINEAIDQWVAHQTERELKPRTVKFAYEKSHRILNTQKYGREPVSFLVGKGKRLYDEFRTSKNQTTGKPLSSATHIYGLVLIKRFGDFLVKSGLLKENPFASVEKIGRVRHGGQKRALTHAEAVAFQKAALSMQPPHVDYAIAALTAVYTGARASEIYMRRVRDLDGAILWISGDVKTESSRRKIKLSPVIAERLHLLAQGRGPEERLFRTATGIAPNGAWLARAVRKVAQKAGLTITTEDGEHLCPQAMRRTFSRLIAETGEGSHVIQATLGHELGTSVTTQSYVGREALRAGQQNRMAELLAAGLEPGNGANPTVPRAENASQATPPLAPIPRRENADFCLASP